jgi:hypothetical protein
MAFPTSLNDQITDAVTQSNVKVVAEAPAMALGTVYQSLAHSTGLMFENAVSHQQNANIVSQAVVTALVTRLAGATGESET